MNHQAKPVQTMNGEKCPFCHRGVLKLIRTNYPVNTPDMMFTLMVWIDSCEECGETVFPPETTDFIQEEIDARRDKE